MNLEHLIQHFLHKAKTRARIVLKHHEVKNAILEKEKKKQIGSETPTKAPIHQTKSQKLLFSS
jgi:hypothetical protein